MTGKIADTKHTQDSVTVTPQNDKVIRNYSGAKEKNGLMYNSLLSSALSSVYI